MRAFRYWSMPLLLAASPAMAQDQSPPPAENSPGEQSSGDEARADPPSRPGEIVVRGERFRGRLETEHPPIATLDEQDIEAIGATSVGELISRVSPQTTSGRGRGDGPPVVMVNGQRITNFREMQNFPPEAIQRVEVLPEEAALKFGYPPDTRVINLILKKKFRSFAVEENTSVPTRGGWLGGGAGGTLVRIDGPARLSLTANLSASNPLFESERDLIANPANTPTVASDPDPMRFRSLIGSSRNYGVNGAWVRGFGKDGLGGTLSLSAAASRVDSHTWQGLDTVRLVAPGGASAIRALPGAIEQNSQVTTLQAGAGYSTYFGSWQFSSTLDFNHGETRSLTDRRAETGPLVAAAAAGTLAINGPLPSLPDAGRDTARSNSNRAESLVTLIGRPIRLPAGGVTTTIKGGFTWIGFESSDQRSLAGPVSLSRFRVLGGLNLAIPLTSRREQFLPGIGDITLNLGADVSHLSDFGTVNGWSAGLTWGVTPKLSLSSSYIVNQSAPAISQLGNPVTVTANVPVYDFTRGETVLVSVTSGGNPLLRKEQQRDLKFGLNWQMPILPGSNLVIEYFRNRSNDVTAAFPLVTPAIESAYPGRVTRDGSGRLVAIDQRPVTFARQDSSRLRWGFNLSAPFGKIPDQAGAPGGAPVGGPPPGAGRGPGPGAGPGVGGPRPPGAGRGGPRGGGMGMMFGAGGGQPGRWSLGVYHTVQFESRILVTPGGPVLDLLDGDSLSASGTPRHSIEFNGGVFYKGLGMFAQGSWNAPTTVAASGLLGTSDLRFGSVTNVNVFMFFDFSQRPKLIKQMPFLKGARVSLSIQNLFDSRQRVTDGSGAVPLSYQPDYIDPRGRVIGIQLRKLF